MVFLQLRTFFFFLVAYFENGRGVTGEGSRCRDAGFKTLPPGCQIQGGPPVRAGLPR